MKQIAKWGAIAAAGLLALGAVVLGLGFVWLNSDSGRAWLSAQIESAASTPGEIELSIGAITGDLPHGLVVQDLSVRDAAGRWLTVSNLALDWHPWQLLHRTIDVERLAFGKIDLARLPATQPEATEEPSGGGLRALLDFPLKVRIDRLAAEEIMLGAPVLGEAARLTLAGEADRRDDGSLSTRLDLRRIDGAEGHLTAALRYDPRDDSLAAEIDAASAPGGLLAALLDMPDLPGTRLTLAGSGPLTDWRGDAALTLGELADVQADVGLRRRDNGDLAFDVQGSSTVRPPQDSDLLRLVAGRSAFALRGAWQGDTRLHLDGLTAANDSLRLALRGDLEPQSGTIDLRLTASTENGDALARLAELDSLTSLSAEIALSGSLDLPQATLDLKAEGVSGPDFAAGSAALTGSVTAERDLLGPAPLLALDLEGRLDAPRLTGQGAVNQVLGDSLPLRLAGRLDLDTLVLDIEDLQATAGSMALSASGPFNLDDGSGRLQAVADLPALADLQPLTEIQLGGQAHLAGPVTLSGFGRRIAADLQGRWERPTSDIALLAATAGQGLDISTRLAIEGPTVRVEQATAHSPETDLAAALTVADGGLRDGRYNLRLADATVLSDALGVAASGPMTAEGAIAGPFDALVIDGRATLAQLTVAEQTLQKLSATHRLTVKGAAVDGPVSVTLSSPFGRAEAGADLQVRSDAVTLASLQAKLPEAEAGGLVRVPLDGGDPIADLTAEVGNLTPWLGIAGLGGGGHGRLAIALNRPDAPAPVTVSAELSDIRLLPEPGATPVTAKRMTIRLQAEDTAFTRPARVDLVATELRWDELTLVRADLGAEGTLDALDVTLDTEGRWQQPLALQAAARVTRQGDSMTVLLDRATGRAFGQPLQLRQPARLTLAPGATRLEGLALNAGEARLAADAALGADGGVSLRARLDALPLDALDVFWDSGLAGHLSAEFDLAGSLDDPRGTARLAARGLRPRDSADVPALEWTTNADWQAGRFKAEGQLGGAEVAAARFSADLPLEMTPDGGIAVPSQAPLSGRLTWNGDLRTVLLFVPLPQHRLSGRADVALDLGGTVATPRAEGRVTLAQGRYENLETGTVLRDLALTAEVNQERIALSSLTGNDGAGGTLSGSGDATLGPERNFPFDVAIRFDKFHAVRRDDVTAVTGGKVTLTGDAAAPHVEGRLTTETVEISLLAELPPNVVSLEVVEVKDGVVQQPPQAEEAASPIDVTLDVVVEMPRRVFVRGRGLDSEWAGRISVQGPADEPAVTGSLNLVRGQLSVVGKPFTLKEGRVTLPEGADTEPALDVTAVHQGSDLTVTAHLHGPVSRPELQLSSVPPVPRDEIVSRVLFNKSAAQLSAAEAAQLAIALRDLTGQGGGTDILGFARRTLGVDVLRIETADDDTPALEAGRYLSDDVYVGVKQGAGAQSSAAGVEVELTPNITLESEVTGKGTNKSGIRFQWDY